MTTTESHRMPLSQAREEVPSSASLGTIRRESNTNSQGTASLPAVRDLGLESPGLDRQQTVLRERGLLLSPGGERRAGSGFVYAVCAPLVVLGMKNEPKACA